MTDLIQQITPERWRFLLAWYDLPANIGYKEKNDDGTVDLNTELVDTKYHRPLDSPTKKKVIAKIKGDVWNEATWRRFAPAVIAYTKRKPTDTEPAPVCSIRVVPVEQRIEYKIGQHKAKGDWKIPKIEPACRPQFVPFAKEPSPSQSPNGNFLDDLFAE